MNIEPNKWKPSYSNYSKSPTLSIIYSSICFLFQVAQSLVILWEVSTNTASNSGIGDRLIGAVLCLFPLWTMIDGIVTLFGVLSPSQTFYSFRSYIYVSMILHLIYYIALLALLIVLTIFTQFHYSLIFLDIAFLSEVTVYSLMTFKFYFHYSISTKFLKTFWIKNQNCESFSLILVFKNVINPKYISIKSWFIFLFIKRLKIKI